MLSAYLQNGDRSEEAVAGAAITVNTFGEFQKFNPHLHIIASDGCFHANHGFARGPKPRARDLENAFRQQVFKMLRAEGRINDFVIDNMMGWRHSGFNVYCGETVWPHDEAGLENLARYVIRALFFQERMVYIPKKASSYSLAPRL